MADIADLISTIRNENIRIVEAEKKRKKDTVKQDKVNADKLQSKIVALTKKIEKLKGEAHKDARESLENEKALLEEQKKNNDDRKTEADTQETIKKTELDLQAKTFGISQQQYSAFLENKKDSKCN